MTDYVAYLASEHAYVRAEAERLVATLKDESNRTIDDAGVIRWTSNGRVVPEDIAALAVHIGLPVNVVACDATRSVELRAFLAAYRANDRGPSEEERFEARAAFGPGVELVNVVTGRKWRT